MTLYILLRDVEYESYKTYIKASLDKEFIIKEMIRLSERDNDLGDVVYYIIEEEI